MDGVEFEGGDHVKDDLYRNVAMFKGDVEVSWGFLSQPIAVATLKKIGAKKDIDVLKMDIDSYDADLLETILAEGYHPKVIMVEMNPDIPPPIVFRQKYATDNFYRKKVFAGNYGASTSAWFELLSENYGYGLVGMEVFDKSYKECPRCEHNMWFVDGSFLKQKGYRVATHEDVTGERVKRSEEKRSDYWKSRRLGIDKEKTTIQQKYKHIQIK